MEMSGTVGAVLVNGKLHTIYSLADTAGDEL